MKYILLGGILLSALLLLAEQFILSAIFSLVSIGFGIWHLWHLLSQKSNLIPEVRMAEDD